MLLALLVVLPSVSVQDGSWADRLRQGGWSAVDLASAQTEAKPDLVALAAGRDAEVASRPARRRAATRPRRFE